MNFKEILNFITGRQVPVYCWHSALVAVPPVVDVRNRDGFGTEASLVGMSRTVAGRTGGAATATTLASPAGYAVVRRVGLDLGLVVMRRPISRPDRGAYERNV